jgi:hypothetical protein
MIDLHTHVRRREGVLHQDVSGSLMLYHMDRGEYFALDDVGARVWDLCDGTRSLSDVVTVLSEEYEAPSTEIGEDVLALIRELADEHLVVTVAS